ncbi:urease accessory protein UreD [Gayadomonas joobiniege]|uniref:urease accessory protein UreD n=1 Tax=Gayadomonas joobiniege TaxID=1234606 RepID=UPI00038219AD|nr:urease accessory protein UreD [Gayadomonas joobiniege]
MTKNWLAQLELSFKKTPVGTRLAQVKRDGPLSVQKAFYPEGPDVAHVYLLHPPAGIVSGDKLYITGQVEAGAHALLTTPGANRFYKARDLSDDDARKQLQHTHFDLAKDAVLEYLPQETLIYPNADAINQLTVKLAANSIYLGWEVLSLGLPVVDKPFADGRLVQQTQVYINGQLKLHDRLNINPENQIMQQLAGLNQQPVLGTFVIASSAQQNDVLALEENLCNHLQQLELAEQFSLTRLDEIILVRYLGAKTSDCKDVFSQLWHIARATLCQREASAPRIWLT